MTLDDDRSALRALWYAQGWYGHESIAEHLRLGVERFPATTMDFVGGPTPTRIRLDEMYARGRRLAAGFASLGVGPGEKVAVWVPNWVEGALTYQAALSLGAVVVPIIHIYGPREVGFILRQSGARVLVMPDRWRNIDYRERFAEIGALPDLHHVVSIGDGPAGSVPWQRLADADPLAELPLAGPDDPCLLIYTSGTTAEPKGVQHSANTLVAEIRTNDAVLGQRCGVSSAAFPAGHIAGVLGTMRMFLVGSSSVVMDQWDPALAARLVEEHRVTSTAGAPFFLDTLLGQAEAQGTSLATLGNYMVGAASVPPALVERADAAGVGVYRAYGSSEHPVITSGTPEDPAPKRARTDGRLMPGSEIRLLDEDDRDVPVGTDGEIVSRGPELMLGYTDAALDADSHLPGGWFRTGDVGRLDADGYLTITDRKKDIIIRGGENIASKEVEDILATHPAVVDAAAVGQPDERYGERVAVFVQLLPGAALDLDEVRRRFAAAGAARQKTPEAILLVDELPRSMSGKVRKVELRDRLRGA
jgi:acyl-CoA synthetase (AMP-forming)/AMP-acid ligase II